jgi:hypothetical protein
MRYFLLTFTLTYILFSCKPSPPKEPGLEKECPDSVYSISTDPWLQYIEIPDPHFEKYLVDKGFDSDGFVNGQIKRSDANEVDSIFLHSSSIASAPEYDVIKSVKGIEHFEKLRVFYSTNELIEKIDFSHNKKLQYVFIMDYHGSVGGGPGRDKYRALKHINLGKNANLKEVVLSSTLLTELDLSGLSSLNKLTIGGYELETIYIHSKKQIKPGWDIIPSNEKTVVYKICENP